MKWYHDFDWRTHKYYYWSMRNESGQCFAIHIKGDKCLLYDADCPTRSISKHDSVQAAMDAAAALSVIDLRRIHLMQYKIAESQGAYIDRLRTQWPYHIFTRGYDAYLCGVQELNNGQHAPIYRFPGGRSLVSDSELDSVVEW